MRLKVSKLNTAALALALAAAGCSKSSVELLKAGDAQVCTKSDVTDQLYEIVKENPGMHVDPKLFPDYPDRLKGWIDKISFSIDAVTSKDVDAPNEKITCNGTVHMKASGVDQEQTASIDYQVVADLSANKPIVTASVGNAGYALGQLVGQIAAPEIQKAQADQAAENLAKDNAFEAAWAQSHADDIAAIQTDIQNQNGGRFSPTEVAAYLHERKLDEECQQSPTDSDERKFICVRADEVTRENSKNNLCIYNMQAYIHCNNPDEPRTGSATTSINAPFTPAEAALVSQAQDLTDRCSDAEGGQNPQVCDQSQAIVDKLKTQGICYGPEDAIEADKHWIRCGGK